MKEHFLSSDESRKSSLLKKRIIQYLIISGESSIADISKEIEMSIPTATKLVMELLEEEFVLDSGKQNTNGGRRPNIYGINPESGYFVGVDVQRQLIMIATIDLNGKMIDEHTNIPYKLQNTPESLDELCATISTYIDSLPVERSKILQVGINLSGRINTASGYSHSFFCFDEQPLSLLIEQKIGIPVVLENDSRAMAYGEYMAGIVKGEKNVIFINVNWGLGSGLILDGKLYYGKSGYSGEFGHISALDNEIICGCGKKGCLETEASGFAMQRILKEKYEQGSTTILADILKERGEVSLSDFVDAVLKEDMLAIEIVEHIGINLGRWLAGLINLFNPELVIIGGPLSLTQDYIQLPIKSALKKYSLNLVNQDTKLKISKLGERAGLIGACLLSRSKTLDIL
jgi:glucokinase-like ROK family protein